MIRADERQMEQILINLSINAQDAMPEGGIIDIDTVNIYIEDGGSPPVPGLGPGNYLILSISDTGSGIDQGLLNQIFDPFFTTKEKGRGTGLGLSTVYGIVQQHEGHITVDSRVGRGSVFRIYLPFLPGKESIDQNFDRQFSEAIHGTETVLLAEDDVTVRNLTAMMLRNLGYSVLVPDSPEAAVELAGKNTDTIQLLLSDVIMPGMNGPALYLKLKELRPGLKVLFMSGYAGEALGRNGISTEGFHLLRKPFSMYRLSKTIREILDTEKAPEKET